MGDTDHIDFTAIDFSRFPWSRLAPEERARLERRIIAEAHDARARAVRDLLRMPLALVRRAARGIGALWRAGARAVERQRAIRQLSALDDRSLRDIGLNRSQIDEAVRGRGPLRPAEPFALPKRHKPSQPRSRTLTSDQKRLIKETWSLVVPIADTAAKLFYDRLFEIDPTARALFKTTNMPEQRKKLMQTLTVALQGLDNLDTLIPVVENLGRRHRGYGVTAAHYESVGAALSWTLEKGLGKAWTPEAATAWAELYGVLSAVMQRAASQSQTTAHAA